jgi:hypothetical protein
MLADGGLRCDELAALERRDFLPARQGARLRALDVRHGQGRSPTPRQLSHRASTAIVRWDREHARAFGAPPDNAPSFVTLGRRRRDGTYTRAAAGMKEAAAASDEPAVAAHDAAASAC